MNVSQLRRKVQIALNDPAILASDILTELNDALTDAAAIVRLPALITSDTVNVLSGASSGDLPANYHHDLYYAYSNTNSQRLTLRSYTKIINAIHDETETGNIEDVAVEDDALMVGPVASADEEIAIKYYKTPTTLSDDSDIPDCIPARLHDSVLASRVIINMLVDTDADIKNIANKLLFYENKYKRGMAKLSVFYPNAPIAKPVLYRVVRTF